MDDLPLLAVRALAGGSFVVAFALIGEAAHPKSFSGLFSAAPSVALAGLLVTALAKTAHAAGEAALGDVTPHDDALASAWYRSKTLPVLVRRALTQLEEVS